MEHRAGHPFGREKEGIPTLLGLQPGTAHISGQQLSVLGFKLPKNRSQQFFILGAVDLCQR